MAIHSTAVVDPSAHVPYDVSIGPYAYIGPRVVIGSGCSIGPHVTILKDTVMGEHNVLHPYAAIGGDPQSSDYHGESTQLVMGDRNVIHEYATINRGTASGGGVTTLGSDNYLMAYIHVAHDCQLGSKIRMINNASLAGHVVVGDNTYISGFVVVHQFCMIGGFSLLTPFSKIGMDVLPCVIIDTDASPSPVRGLNRVGLQRAGFSQESMNAIKHAYKIVFRSGLLMEQIKEELSVLARERSEYAWFLDAILSSTRGVLR